MHNTIFNNAVPFVLVLSLWHLPEKIAAIAMCISIVRKKRLRFAHSNFRNLMYLGKLFTFVILSILNAIDSWGFHLCVNCCFFMLLKYLVWKLLRYRFSSIPLLTGASPLPPHRLFWVPILPTTCGRALPGSGVFSDLLGFCKFQQVHKLTKLFSDV